MNTQKLLDNFSTHLKNVIARAISFGVYLKSQEIEPIHILVALMQEPGAVAGQLLIEAGFEEKKLLEIVGKINNYQTTLNGHIPELSQLSQKIMEKALTIAYEMSHNYIGTEHLLWGIIKSQDKNLEKIFTDLKINQKLLADHTEIALQNSSRFSQVGDIVNTFEQMPDMEINNSKNSDPLSLLNNLGLKPNKKKNLTPLQNFTVNLTDKNKQKQIDPVIGREKEINRIINILCRRNKNNPILIGEPGVGKTAIVEGLAKKISEGNVPEILKMKKILSLDLTLLLAGTIYRGEFESRLKQIIDEVSADNKYILFIDELHNIIGAGSNQGTMDAANILKPALARGSLRCIGATTYEEYKKYIANDPALERRFQSINISEPNQEDTLKILQGIKKYYEEFHHLKITDKAIKASVELSARYINDQFQPDKAIDLLDEASANVKANRIPTQNEITKIKLVNEFETLKIKKEEALGKEKLKEALEFKKQESKIEKKINSLENKIQKEQNTTTLKVKESDIIKILSDRLGVEMAILEKNEWENLKDLETRLENKIIGQEHVIKSLVATLRKKYLSPKTNRPIASILFAGPSGVGKTELAKILAEELYHDKKALIRLDMSEFAEAHSASKILGSPAGYIGYKDRNRFMDEIRQHPYSIILFDEIDKAHNDVRKLLWQILDDGELTDSGGKKIHFKQSIIILTTNLGSDLFKSTGIGFGKTDQVSKQKEITENIIKKLKEEFSASLIGRIDEICVFQSLTPENLEKIIKQNIDKLNAYLKTTQQIVVETDDQTIKNLQEKIYEPDIGARHIEQDLSNLINELLVKLLSEKKHKEKYSLVSQKNEFKLV